MGRPYLTLLVWLALLGFGASPWPLPPSPVSKKIVLIAGAKSHGPRYHEYIKTVRLLKVMLDEAPNLEGLTTEIHYDGWPEDPRTLDDADLIMTVSDGQDGPLFAPVPFMTPDRMPVMERQMKRGAGFITFHFSTFAPDTLAPQILEWGGGYFDWQDDTGARNWYSAIQTLDTLVTLPNPHHPIARGLPTTFRLHDEFYYNIRFRPTDLRFQPIVTVPALAGTQDHGSVVAWAVERADGGRGFGTTMGHFFANWENDHFRKLMLNAIVWTAGVEVPAEGVTSRFYTDQEVTQYLFGASMKALILTGRHHPAHPWPATTEVLKSTLEADERIHVDVSTNIEDLGQYDLTDYHFLVLNYCNWEQPEPLSPSAQDAFSTYLSAGGGLVVVHFANGAFHYSLPGAGASDWPEYRRIVRRVWDHSGDSGHDPYGPFHVRVTDIKHPITEGLHAFETTDELYYNQQGDLPIEPLLTARSSVTNRDEPLAWAYPYGQGRIFQTVLGHDDDALRTPGVQRLIRRAGLWTAAVLSDTPR